MPSLSDLPELFPPEVANEVKRIIGNARRKRGEFTRRIWICSKLLGERGGFPARPGEDPRSDCLRVRELAWRLEQLADMIRLDLDLAKEVFAGRELWHVAIMITSLERGMYEGEIGDLRYQMDAEIQHRLDPTVDVSR
jgi:hypothetical protein